jgi:hypothetical protein
MSFEQIDTTVSLPVWHDDACASPEELAERAHLRSLSYSTGWTAPDGSVWESQDEYIESLVDDDSYDYRLSGQSDDDDLEMFTALVTKLQSATDRGADSSELACLRSLISSYGTQLWADTDLATRARALVYPGVDPDTGEILDDEVRMAAWQADSDYARYLEDTRSQWEDFEQQPEPVNLYAFIDTHGGVWPSVEDFIVCQLTHVDPTVIPWEFEYHRPTILNRLSGWLTTHLPWPLYRAYLRMLVRLTVLPF